MKVILLALFVAAVVAAPRPEDDGGAVEMIVNGVPEGAALEVSEIVDIELNEHADGEIVSSTNLLHPYTAVGIAEAAAAAASKVSVVDNELARRPNPVPIVNPSPAVVPEPVVIPAPAEPEVKPEVEVKPETAPVAAELYNDGIVQVQYNGPEEPSMLSTLQNWFSMVINYFNKPEASERS